MHKISIAQRCLKDDVFLIQGTYTDRLLASSEVPDVLFARYVVATTRQFLSRRTGTTPFAQREPKGARPPEHTNRFYSLQKQHSARANAFTTRGARQKTNKRARQEMDALPLELVSMVITNVEPLTLPLLRCVHPWWNDLIRTLPRRRSLAKRDRHRCSCPAECAKHYAQTALKRARWSVFHWMVDCAGSFGSANDLDKRACMEAASHGDLARIERLIGKHGYRCDNNMVATYAARRGHLHILEWVFGRAYALPTHICTDIAQSGRIDIIRWAKAKGYTWNEHTFDRAAQYGHLRTLQWLRNQGCPAGPRACQFAAGRGHLRVLQWLRANDAPWDAATVVIAAAVRGHLRVVRWAVGQGCPLTEKAAARAASHGHLGVLVWMHDNGCPMPGDLCEWAASAFHFDVVKWARAKGLPLSAYACEMAAVDGNLPMLVWLRKQGCPWNERTCAGAAAGGHLDILQWARGSGCPWNEGVTDGAIMNGHLQVLQWALANGHPQSARDPQSHWMIKLAVLVDESHIADWLYEQLPYKDKNEVCLAMAQEGRLEA